MPVTTRDPDRTGFILEAFSAKSAEIVTPAFYDKTLIGKSTRDDESAEMLELIFSSKKYDIGNFFAWGDLTNKVMTAWNKKNENIENCGGAYNPAKEAAVSCPRAAKNQKQSGGIIRGAATYILKSGKPQRNGRRAE